MELAVGSSLGGFPTEFRARSSTTRSNQVPARTLFGAPADDVAEPLQERFVLSCLEAVDVVGRKVRLCLDEVSIFRC